MSSENLSDSSEKWIQIPLRADEPAHCALFKHFLNEQRFAYTESATDISVLESDTERLAEAVEVWAFDHEMPDDERNVDTLNALLREIGNIVMDRLDGTPSLPRALVNGIDLRQDRL